MSQPDPTDQPGLSFEPRALIDLYHAADWNKLCTELLEDLKHFEDTTYHNLSDSDQQAINEWVRNFLYVFSQPDFVIPDVHVAPFIRHGATIANMAAISCFGSTDPFLACIMAQPCNLAKILTLYGPRNKIIIDPTVFFGASPDAAALWYCVFAQSYRGGLGNADVLRRTAQHFTAPDARFAPPSIQECYFGSTYVDGVCDRPIKQAVNRHLRTVPALRSAHIVNTPNPRKIAVITGRWWEGHSVWRTLRAYVASLKEAGYHLTLIPVHEVQDQNTKMDASLFDEVRQLPMKGGEIDIGPLRENDFGAVYYPDIGMTPGSILLSNLRLAPVQLMGTGHPVSTWGSEIDYFISGDEVEAPGAQRMYSERLVLLPGLGAIYDQPTYKPIGRVNTTGKFLINCSWYGQKVNAVLIEALRKILAASTRPLHFRIFAGIVLGQRNEYLPFTRELQRALPGAVVDVAPNLDYPQYMGFMEEGDMGLDCYHFGGSNTVSDNLHLRKPVVTWEGSHWYGRIGSALVRRAGLPELAATCEAEYVEKALRLIHDDEYRAELTERLERADLAATVYDQSEARHFAQAVAYLIENHAVLRRQYEREPIIIARDHDEHEPLRLAGSVLHDQEAEATAA